MQRVNETRCGMKCRLSHMLLMHMLHMLHMLPMLSMSHTSSGSPTTQGFHVLEHRLSLSSIDISLLHLNKDVVEAGGIPIHRCDANAPADVYRLGPSTAVTKVVHGRRLWAVGT